MQVWCDWQLTLCDPHLSALEVRFHDDALYKSMFTFTYLYPLVQKLKKNRPRNTGVIENKVARFMAHRVYAMHIRNTHIDPVRLKYLKSMIYNYAGSKRNA